MALPIRGVRALERGGAFIAGADDADALWLDPAGLAHADAMGTTQFLFDVAYVAQYVDYTRVDDTGTPMMPVSNQQPASLVPTLAAAYTVSDRLVIAGGIAEPYAGLHRYDGGGPQRYAAESLAGSTFVTVTLGAAYAVSDRLRVGATVQNIVSSLDARFVAYGCPEGGTCGMEDRDYDMPLHIEQHDYFAPSGSLGIQYDVAHSITLGAAVQGPTRVSALGTLTTTLPTNTLFTDAQVVGDSARMSFTLPPALRAGIELRPSNAHHVEAAVAIELWGLHDAITIAPDDVYIDTSTGMHLPLHAMTIARDYRTSIAPSLGAEYHLGPAMFGAGVAYETAAAPAADVSVLTVDAPKLIVGAGGGYAEEGWQIGAAAGYGKLTDVDVAPADAAVIQLQPLRDRVAPVRANAGSYRSSYFVAGLRMARRF
jgi:long-chain fatty acid transport protein